MQVKRHRGIHLLYRLTLLSVGLWTPAQVGRHRYLEGCWKGS
jgi:hypothetical protein